MRYKLNNGWNFRAEPLILRGGSPGRFALPIFQCLENPCSSVLLSVIFLVFLARFNLQPHFHQQRNRSSFWQNHWQQNHENEYDVRG